MLWPIFDSNWLRYARHIGVKKKHTEKGKRRSQGEKTNEKSLAFFFN